MAPLPRLEELRTLAPEALATVAEDLRAFILASTQDKAGHLASSLGVAELTVVLHALMNTPEDVLIWDVGHQAYGHKVLTDRAEVFSKNRQLEGPSGFPKREESPFDAFGVGHSSTALSALLGFARADALKGLARKRVAVVGDGAFTGGMVFEAMNDAGSQGDDVLLILNDNGQAIEENWAPCIRRPVRHRRGPELTWMGGLIDGLLGTSCSRPACAASKGATRFACPHPASQHRSAWLKRFHDRACSFSAPFCAIAYCVGEGGCERGGPYRGYGAGLQFGPLSGGLPPSLL